MERHILVLDVYMLWVALARHNFKWVNILFLFFHVALNPYRAGIDLKCQNLTSDVYPRTVRINIFIIAVDP